MWNHGKIKKKESNSIEKIYEKLMYNCLVSFLNTHDEIYSRQFGFRKSHSTVHTHQSTKIVERNSEVACGVFVDLQKAIDTVDHYKSYFQNLITTMVYGVQLITG